MSIDTCAGAKKPRSGCKEERKNNLAFLLGGGEKCLMEENIRKKA